MIKVGPPFPAEGTVWDHKGKTEIAQIIISCSRTRINFMYFNYVEDGGNKLVLSAVLGSDITCSHSMETVTFDYPSEYITRVSGRYMSKTYEKYLCSITFHTNKGTYGPYVPGELSEYGQVIDFNYQVGGKFCGFFGSYDSYGIENIGFYVETQEKLQSLSFVHDFERKDLMILIEQNAKIERLAEQVNRLSNKDEKPITRNEVLDFTSKLNEIKDLLISIRGSGDSDAG